MKLSVLLSVRNEADYLPDLLADLEIQEDPGCELEFLVADGDSEDATPKILADWHDRSRYVVRQFDNPARLQYPGVNLLIKEATGDLLVKIDGHSRLASDFLRRVVEAQRAGHAEIVGGVMESVGDKSLMASAISAAQAARFGGGAAAFRQVTRGGYADAVWFLCARREVFSRVGLFREELVRNSDTEFFARVRAAGIRIWLDPAIRATYFVRPTLRHNAWQQFQNGYWFPACLRAARLRHFVPLFFVLALLALPLLAVLAEPLLLPAAAALLVPYAIVVVGAAISAQQRGLGVPARLLMLAVLPAMHVSYGCGWLAGFLSPRVWRAASAVRKPPPSLAGDAQDQ